MARRRISFAVTAEHGPRLGSGTEVRVYSDDPLTTLKTLYADAASGSTVPNPILPNGGFQSALAVTTLTTDLVAVVLDVSGFQVGDRVPLYNGTTTVYRTVTAINPGTKTLTFSEQIGVAFSSTNSYVGNPDMIGHIHAYVVDDTDVHLQAKDLASTRVLPPTSLPTLTPVTTIEFQEEGAVVSTRGRLNAVGTGLTMTDDGPGTRALLTHGDLPAHGGILAAAQFNDASHGVRTTAAAHAYSHISGTHGESAHDAGVTDDVKKWALIT